MTRLTRNGVCNNLNKSPYKVQVQYGDKEITFYFSSQFNVDRFNDKLEDNRLKINCSLANRFKFEMKQNIIADLKLYSVVEQRGFFISSNGVFFECLENLKLDGENLMSKN